MDQDTALRAGPARTIGVAASTALADLVTGPVVAGRVAAAGRLAAYVLAPGRVVALVASGAVAPASAVHLPEGLTAADVVREGDVVGLGDGAVAGASVRLVVRRWVPSPAMPTGTPDSSAVAVARRLLAASGPAAGDAARRRALDAAGPAACALARGDADAAMAHLVAVLGLGPGSTPTGDDVAAGLLLAARAAGSPAVGRCGAAVLAAATSRTSVVSAALLAEAAAGRAPDVVVRWMAALWRTGPESGVRAATVAVLRVGHTSGADLATGVVAAAEAFADTAGVTRSGSTDLQVRVA